MTNKRTPPTVAAVGISTLASHGFAPNPSLLESDGVDSVTVKGNLTISDTDGNNKIDVGEFMRTINERLCVLQPVFEAHERYPALKDAYEQYKMLEKLLVGHNVSKD